MASDFTDDRRTARDPEVAALAARHGLRPHREGGHFREVFRSAHVVQPADGRGPRPERTEIEFLLPRGERSRWHRLRSTEIWEFLDGEPLELWIGDSMRRDLQRVVVGRPADGHAERGVVPPGHWQAARPLGRYTLVRCSVEPGFVPEDFVLGADDPESRHALSTLWPELAEFL